MKILSLLLILCLLTGCGIVPVASVSPPETTPAPTARFDSVTQIQLSDSGITVDGGPETDTVYTSHDIIYYEDRITYDSGNPYGEGTAQERHSAEEAAAHTVVNITAPGAYRVSGKLSQGQLRIDLGGEAYGDENAVVALILHNADITCTVAPAILFLNVYECDTDWSVDTASASVDTSAAGANLILEGENTVTGSHVAKIFKDTEGEKKLWKQDGALYSYMSMNVSGTGSLDLTADNEGMDTELHLTINGGKIAIRSGNDGINTNEDGVSVTTINGGEIRILAGLDAEGDGIDSNGYLVINGGTVIASANPAADAGLDSDLGSYIHGGTVAAFGSTMDWAESDSRQVTMNLQFAEYQHPGSAIEILRGDDSLFSFDFCADPVLCEAPRQYMGAILSCPDFQLGEIYHVYVDGTQQGYSGTDVGRGGPAAFGGGMPPEMPQGQEPPARMEPPEGMERPEGMEPPEGMERPEGMEPPGDSFRGPVAGSLGGEIRKEFHMADMVNAFSGVTAVEV